MRPPVGERLRDWRQRRRLPPPAPATRRAAARGGAVPSGAVGPALMRPPVGELLRDWRQRRRLSQLDLANDAEVSARHLSFLETGRSPPTRGVLLRPGERPG